MPKILSPSSWSLILESGFIFSFLIWFLMEKSRWPPGRNLKNSRTFFLNISKIVTQTFLQFFKKISKKIKMRLLWGGRHGYLQPIIKKTEWSAKNDGLTLVTPWYPLLYIFQQNLFYVKRPQLSITIKTVPITSCS